jgi:coenzyme F420-0:L-glutamate ligase / coenzyme F420-1:gamma-L-glutamate ligase
MADRLAKYLGDHRVRDFLSVSRVAHLATATPRGEPHCVPLCFWFDHRHFYFIVDEKPKRSTGRELKRIRNIVENPRVALIIDHYEDKWSNLAYVMVQGVGQIVEDPEEYTLALRNLRDKYPQYRSMNLVAERNLIVRIDPDKMHVWGTRFGSAEKGLA